MFISLWLLQESDDYLSRALLLDDSENVPYQFGHV
jgi:hypothetical protein